MAADEEYMDAHQDARQDPRPDAGHGTLLGKRDLRRVAATGGSFFVPEFPRTLLAARFPTKYGVC